MSIKPLDESFWLISTFTARILPGYWVWWHSVSTYDVRLGHRRTWSSREAPVVSPASPLPPVVHPALRRPPGSGWRTPAPDQCDNPPSEDRHYHVYLPKVLLLLCCFLLDFISFHFMWGFGLQCDACSLLPLISPCLSRTQDKTERPVGSFSKTWGFLLPQMSFDRYSPVDV